MTTVLPAVAVTTRRRPVPCADALAVYTALARHFGEEDVYLLESGAGPAADATIAVVGFRRLLSVSVRDRTVRLAGWPSLTDTVATAVGDLSTPDGELVEGATAWDALRAVGRSFDAPGSGSEFTFGFLAYFGYDAVRHIERLPRRIPAADDAPEITLGLYQGFVLIRLAERQAELVVHGGPGWPELDIDEVAGLVHAASRAPASALPAVPPPGGVTDSTDQATFQEDVRRCLAHIAVGDIYQVQIGHELAIVSAAGPVEVYRRLRERNPSPYMYLAEVAGRRLVGASPELFVRVSDGEVTMRPIAGTAPRTGDDSGEAQRLRTDPKELAEHVMLVDLCRNDIGRVCRPGTLAVRDLCTVETYSHVQHLVSTVTAELASEVDPYAVVAALFPAGTMTGAPKIRAMEIIEELESTRRGSYAGAIGLVDVGGYINLALCIRMLVHDGSVYRTRASAGVVADSDPAREWRETRAKLSAAYWAVTGEEYLT